MIRSNNDRYKNYMTRLQNNNNLIKAAVRPHITKKKQNHHHTTIEEVKSHLGIRQSDISLNENIKKLLSN